MVAMKDLKNLNEMPHLESNTNGAVEATEKAKET